MALHVSVVLVSKLVKLLEKCWDSHYPRTSGHVNQKANEPEVNGEVRRQDGLLEHLDDLGVFRGGDVAQYLTALQASEQSIRRYCRTENSNARQGNRPGC